MIFMDKLFWTKKVPAYDLLTSMAKGKEYEKLIQLTDDPDEAIKFLLAFYHMKKPMLRRLSTAPATKSKGK